MFIRGVKKTVSDASLQDIVGVDREGNEVRFEDKIADDADSVDDQVGLKMQISRLKEAIFRVLHGREKKVIAMRYGLNESGEEMTQREIADKLKISRSYVSRIEKKALAKLRKVLSEG